jgi:hypothetical protein
MRATSHVPTGTARPIPFAAIAAALAMAVATLGACRSGPRTPAEPTGPTCGDLSNTRWGDLSNTRCVGPDEHVLPYRRTAPHPAGRDPTDDTGEQARCSERTNTTDAARPTTRYQPGCRYSRTVASGPDDRAAHRRRHTAR